MNEQPKSLGGAIVEVFDAALDLLKTEISIQTRRIGKILRAKGMGVVLLLAALVPITLALIFLILFFYYGLIRLGLAPWSASLILFLVSLIVAAIVALIGARMLTAEVKDDTVTPQELRQEAYQKAEKQVETAEKNVEKAEKNLDKAQTNLDKKAEAAGIPVSTKPTADVSPQGPAPRASTTVITPTDPEDRP